MSKRVLSRIASLSLVGGLLLLATHGTASAFIFPFPHPAPELDPGTATSGLILAVGAALLLVERFRHR
jgi:hypothetical protein